MFPKRKNVKHQVILILHIYQVYIVKCDVIYQNLYIIIRNYTFQPENYKADIPSEENLT